jgi:hypothetical protein
VSSAVSPQLPIRVICTLTIFHAPFRWTPASMPLASRWMLRGFAAPHH